MVTNKQKLLSQGCSSCKIESLGKRQSLNKNSDVPRWIRALIVRAILPNVKFDREAYNVAQK